MKNPMVSGHFRLIQSLTAMVPVKKKINIACAVPACNKFGLVKDNTAEREWNFTDKSFFPGCVETMKFQAAL